MLQSICRSESTKSSCLLLDLEPFKHSIAERTMAKDALAPREDKGGREGIPHTHPFFIGNSCRVIFRIGIKLPRGLRGCLVEVSHD